MKGPWTLPNFITLLRLAALPFFLLAIADGRFGIALGLFVAAGISDGIDGYLARNFGMKSALGAYLDPLADKLLLMSSYVFLAILATRATPRCRSGWWSWCSRATACSCSSVSCSS